MAKILIADDEKMMRLGLESMLKKYFEDKVECVLAENGIHALELIKDRTFDLAIVDINMPFLSGLELIEELSKFEINISIIIVSGYQEFTYAQKALRLGVIDYITKPVQKDTLLERVENILQASNQKREQEELQNVTPVAEEKYKQSLLVQLINQNISESVVAELKGDRILGDKAFKRMLCIHYIKESNDVETNHSVTTISKIEQMIQKITMENVALESTVFTYAKDCVAVLVESDSFDNIDKISSVLESKKTWIEKQVGCKYSIGIGETVTKFTQISISFEQSLYASDKKIFIHGSGIFKYKKGVVDLSKYYPFTFTKEELMKTLKIILKVSDVERKLVILRWYYLLLLNKNYSQEEAMTKAKNFHYFWNIHGLKMELENNIIEITERTQSSNNQSDMLEGITHFIQNHLREELDINYIAQEYRKSPGYLGMIFKKKYNIGINEFIMKERMQLAKNLLQNSDMNINEISNYCGYNSPKYFAVSFKKSEGISPSQFKQLYKKGERIHV